MLVHSRKATEAHEQHTPQRRQLPPPTRQQPQQHGERKTKQQQQKRKHGNHSETSFDIFQKNARCLNSGDRFDDPSKRNGTPFSSAKHGDKNKKNSGNQKCGHVYVYIYGRWWLRSKARSWNTLEPEMENERLFRQSTSANG